jgi:L-rhamnose 1-dehydrogenase
MLLDGKVVIVTGASRGIGRACAVVCAREGAAVVVNYCGSESVAGQVVKEIEKNGGRAIAVQGSISLFINQFFKILGDVADPETGTKLVDAAVHAFGKVDVLVANAGICPFHSFVDMPPEIFKKVIDTNLGGTFYTTQAVAKRLIEQGHGGAIVAISSISALLGGEFQV